MSHHPAEIVISTHPCASAVTAVGAPVVPQRARFIQLLQIAGAGAIVGFHVNAPGSQAGWLAVEWFFVIAGMNMSSTWVRQPALASYAESRMRRLLPEVLVVWLAALIALLAGKGTAAMIGFVVSAPVFLQNLTMSFDQLEFRDAVFAPLWFVGALYQLQLFLYATRRFWQNARPWQFVAAACVLGLGSRLTFVLLATHHWRAIPAFTAEALYFMPFCHIEAIVLGVLLGRGALARLGRWLPACLLAAAAAGRISGGTFGYDYPLHRQASYLWGYPLLALAAASICAKRGPLTTAIDRLRLPPVLERVVANLSVHSYGIYCFHGLLIATGINCASRLAWLPSSASRTLVFFITIGEALMISVLFARLRLCWSLRRGHGRQAG